MSKVTRQMPTSVGRASVAHGEAVGDPASDETCGPRHDTQDTGTAPTQAEPSPLLRQALKRENLQQAWERVKANKGAAGVDGLSIEQTAQWLRTNWPTTRNQLL